MKIDYDFICPPSTLKIDPVIKFEIDDDKYVARKAISSGDPSFFNATSLLSIWRTLLGSERTFLCHTEPSKLILPGAIALILIPFSPRGFEIPLTYILSADLEIEYVIGASFMTSNPQIEDMHTITPFVLDRCSNEASTKFVALKKFILKDFNHSS